MLYKQSNYRTNILHSRKISFLQTYLSQSTWKKKKTNKKALNKLKNQKPPSRYCICLGNNSCPFPLLSTDPKVVLIQFERIKLLKNATYVKYYVTKNIYWKPKFIYLCWMPSREQIKEFNLASSKALFIYFVIKSYSYQGYVFILST